jgi:hypothetical protein
VTGVTVTRTVVCDGPSRLAPTYFTARSVVPATVGVTTMLATPATRVRSVPSFTEPW